MAMSIAVVRSGWPGCGSPVQRLICGCSAISALASNTRMGTTASNTDEGSTSSNSAPHNAPTPAVGNTSHSRLP